MKMAKTKIFSLLLALSIFSAYGCAALIVGGAAAGGTYVYVSGKMSRDYNASLDASYDAVIKACDALKMSITSKTKKVAEASVEAKDGDTQVWIDLESKAKDVTTITVRYGTFGDEAASRTIHEQIDDYIPVVPAKDEKK